MTVRFRAIGALAVGMMALTGVSACSEGAEEPDNVFTLYRTGANAPNARFQWATFESFRRAEKNREDCEMTARIMNANMEAYSEKTGAPQYGEIGFWCGEGAFSTEGKNPGTYPSEYPSNTYISPRVGE